MSVLSRIVLGALPLAPAAPAVAGEWDGFSGEDAPRIAPHADRVARTGDMPHLRFDAGDEVAFANPAAPDHLLRDGFDSPVPPP